MDKHEMKSKKKACDKFIEELAELLKDTYVMVGSCNQDFSRYLVPIGTEQEITYHSKPEKSFRVSDHWNWFSNLKKCSDPNYVQCRSLDMPWVRKRTDPNKASEPRFGIQVCIQLADGCYHHVFGDKFDRKTKTWEWVENTPELIIDSYLKGD